MATYSDATEAIRPMVDELVGDFYPDLLEGDVTIGGLFAYAVLDESGEPKAPAITQNGRAVLFRVKVNSEADRLEGKPDATITVDHAEWQARTDDGEAGRSVLMAGVDECLYALEVLREKEGNAIKTDDHGRAKLKVKKPDWTFTGFRAVAERHKAASYEVRQARELHDAHGNILFSFADELDVRYLPGVDAEKPKRKRGAASVAAARR